MTKYKHLTDPTWSHLSIEDRFRQRFLGHCELVNGILGCWLFNGEPSARGKFLMVDRRVWKASRASYALFVGALDERDDVLHRCHCVGCVNPLHLYPGTDKDNTLDRQRSGRSRGRWSKTRVETAPWSDEDFLLHFFAAPSDVAKLIKLVCSLMPIPDAAPKSGGD